MRISFVYVIFLSAFISLFLQKIKILSAMDLSKNKDKKILDNFKEAMFYERLDDKKIKCNLCPKQCVLTDGKTGFCRVRQNIDGHLYSINYGKVAALNVDPIEKKPFFHFLPGTKSFSIACAGCNLRCKYCQNWYISQRGPNEGTDKFISPEKLVELALKSGSKSIAYTYSEPIVFYEYMIDCAKIAKKRGLKNVVITAGFINEKPLKELIKYIDAFKIDLKGFNKDFYLKYTSGGLDPILDTIKIIKKSGKHLEIVNLIIPGANDTEEDIRNLSKWIKENIGADIPIHFSRFYPSYKMTQTPPTPKDVLVMARKIAIEEGLKYVYTGNIENPDGENTYCPDGSIAIERNGFFVLKNNLKNDKCADGSKIYGLFN